jgi:glycosyltransferase involved in cell wall biosynthesis
MAALAQTTIPEVSILTPTFNRRALFPQLVRCVLGQTWLSSSHTMEWIILDDGTDPVEDLLPSSGPKLSIRYERLASRLPLGEKRNRLHAMARAEIAIYFDDDDYHFPDRVLHSMQTLKRHPKALAAGCSELPVWFLPEDKLHIFGPFSASHATCGTMAVRRKLFARRSFEPSAMSAEESVFLDGWRVPLVQLDPWRVILCIAHARNTVEKRAVRDRLLERGGKGMRDSAVSAVRLIPDAASREFYRSLKQQMAEANE